MFEEPRGEGFVGVRLLHAGAQAVDEVRSLNGLGEGAIDKVSETLGVGKGHGGQIGEEAGQVVEVEGAVGKAVRGWAPDGLDDLGEGPAEGGADGGEVLGAGGARGMKGGSSVGETADGMGGPVDEFGGGGVGRAGQTVGGTEDGGESAGERALEDALVDGGAEIGVNHDCGGLVAGAEVVAVLDGTGGEVCELAFVPVCAEEADGQPAVCGVRRGVAGYPVAEEA